MQGGVLSIPLAHCVRPSPVKGGLFFLFGPPLRGTAEECSDDAGGCALSPPGSRCSPVPLERGLMCMVGPLCVASLRASPELESASAWPQISADRWRAPWESEMDDWAPETFGRDQAVFAPLTPSSSPLLGEMPGGQRGELLALDVFGTCGPLCVASLRVSPAGRDSMVFASLTPRSAGNPWGSCVFAAD